MKQKLCLLLFVLLNVFIVFSFSGCKLFCDHDFSYKETISTGDCNHVRTELHVCQKCSKEKKVYGNDINHTGLVTIMGYAATCTEHGLTDGSKCTDCNQTLKAQEVIPAGHKTMVTKQAKNPTCTEAGYTEEITCSVCTSVVSSSITLEALGHKEAYNINTAATCLKPGTANGSFCSVCNATVSSETITIPAKGHIDQTLDEICDFCSALMGDNIIEISTLTELKSVSFNTSERYRLVADISLDENWMPLGTQDNPFTGYFDGNGHTISGLSLNNSTEGGIFLYNSGTITNLTVKTVTVSVTNCNLTFGAIAAYNNGAIKYCSVNGQNSLNASVDYSVNGSINTQYRAEYTVICGGIVGINEGKVENCMTQGSFVCNYSNNVTFKLNAPWIYVPNGSDDCEGTSLIYFGGIAGKNNGTVENCAAIQNNSNTIKVNANLSSRYGCVYAHTKAYIGSLIGSNTSTVKNCKTVPSIIDTDIGPSSGDGKSYLSQTTLTIDKKSSYYLTIGENKGTVSGLVLL